MPTRALLSFVSPMQPASSGLCPPDQAKTKFRGCICNTNVNNCAPQHCRRFFHDLRSRSYNNWPAQIRPSATAARAVARRPPAPMVGGHIA